MTATLAQYFWEAAITAFGSTLLVYGVFVFIMVLLFLVTRQNLATSLLLSIIALDGLDRVANEPYLSLLYIVAKFLVFGLIGYAIATTIFRK
jgi:hypothetical protein